MFCEVVNGDCVEQCAELEADSFDAVVTDPPYHLTQVSRKGAPRINDPTTPFGRHHIGERGFMGKIWDGGNFAFKPETWAAFLRVAKPGAHLVAFGGARTYHRLTCAIEDAGWEIRDCLMWIYGSGFPKSLNVSKAIDKAAGVKRKVIGQKIRGDVEKAKSSGVTMAAATANRNNKDIFGYGIELLTQPTTDAAKQWDGWGTNLKPAWEPIILARKPLIGTVAHDVQAYGTGALNIDGCRIETDEKLRGRWPANVIHDGSDEVLAEFPETKSGSRKAGVYGVAAGKGIYGEYGDGGMPSIIGNQGSAARFFYCAKASKKERGEGNKHPTVKPVALMRWLVRMVTPPNGLVLDPFCGSGTTGVACKLEGFDFVGFELNQQDADFARERITQ